MISQIFTALETADPYIVYGVMVVGCVVVVAILESLFPAYQQTNNQNRRLCANFGLAAINMGLALALPLSSAWALELCRSNGFGLLNWLASSLWISVPISVAAASLGAWLSHYAMHRVPLFWRFHAIHHSDREMDYSTSLRHHPGSHLIMPAMTTPVMAVLGLHPETIAVMATIYWAANIFSHANVRIPRHINARLAWLIITPTMHAVHHSSWRPETDSNFGALFSGWDRLFGTLREDFAATGAEIKLGLEEISPAQSRDLIGLLLHPARTVAAAPTLPQPAQAN